MDEALRRSAAHVLVADVDVPVLDDAAGHHLGRVLRLRDGASVTVTDGVGHWRQCRFAGGAVEAVAGVVTVPRPPEVTIAVAPPKGDRLDWLVQKVTEVGVARIVLVAAEHSVVRWDGERAARQLDRLRRIAAEASMQSRRVWLPEVCGPVPAAEVLGVVGRRRAGRPRRRGRRSIDRHRTRGRVVADGAGAGRRPRVARAARAARRDGGGRGRRPDGGRVVTEAFGVYLHVPFCSTRCDYCAFATWTDRPHLVGDYLDALRTEIGREVDAGMPAATSVFVGGGTPTLVPPEGLAAVLRAIPLAPGAEVTVECNPDDVTEAMFDVFVGAGVNRVSIGVQSMVPHVLQALGRTHDPANVERAVAAARSVGLPTFNLDLIYGSIGESIDDWRTTVQRALELDPPHVSAYALTVEAGTPLADDPARHPDDDVQADDYELADDLLTAAGLANYEVSNWARPGHECRHNLLYWRQQDYRGFGCAAHSHRAGRRWWNLRTPERYIAAVRDGQTTEAAGESLDAATRRFEGLELSLRTTDGVPVDALDGDDLPGVVERVGDRWVLTRRGRLMANDVAVRLR